MSKDYFLPVESFLMMVSFTRINENHCKKNKQEAHKNLKRSPDTESHDLIYPECANRNKSRQGLLFSSTEMFK